jgi:hypothetical protein
VRSTYRDRESGEKQELSRQVGRHLIYRKALGKLHTCECAHTLALGAGHNTPDGVLCKYVGSIPNTVRILMMKYVGSMLVVDYHTLMSVTSKYCNIMLDFLSSIGILLPCYCQYNI